MKIYELFQEWIGEGKAKKDFVEFWMKNNSSNFMGQSDAKDEYDCEQAWRMLKLEEEIQELKRRLKSIEDN